MKELVQQVLAEARSAWRFRWHAVAAAWSVGLLGLGVVLLLPDIYGAYARVYVDGSSVLRPLLTDRIVAPNVEATLLYARQALLGKDYLQRVAHENGLDAEATNDKEREKVLEELAEEIVINAGRADPSDPSNSSSIFTFWYRHEHREVAEGVVRSFVSFLIEDATDAGRAGSDMAARFLDDRIAEHEARLEKAERALAQFQRANADTLPGNEGGYFERIQQEKEALDKLRRDLRLAQARQQQLKRKLTSEAPVAPGDLALSARPRPESIDERIRVQRADLDTMLLKYTDRHPEVIARKESLARLEAQRVQQLRALGIRNPEQRLSSLEANPVHQALQIAVNEAEVEIAMIEADIRDREQRLEELQSLVDKVPAVEAELARLNRDYDIVKAQYEALIESRETQQLSQQASSTDKVDFKILDPPRAGAKPVAPRRLLLLAAVLAAALGSGAGLSFVLAQLKPVFSSMQALRAISGLPVLGSVTPVFVGPLFRAERRFAVVSFSAAIALLVLLIGGVAVFELVDPGGV
ncbi:MAG TPA: XrtA system polysaccharide chain length determinant [Gammaproteobacteria bacterium]